MRTKSILFGTTLFVAGLIARSFVIPLSTAQEPYPTCAHFGKPVFADIIDPHHPMRPMS